MSKKRSTSSYFKLPGILFFCFCFGNVSAQQTDIVDFINIGATLGFDAEKKMVSGKYFTEFKVLKSTDSVFLDAIRMKINDSEKSDVKVTSDEKKIWLHGPFDVGETYSVIFYYEAFPKQTIYFTGDQIWTQGQGKYTSHWLPSIDDMNDKIEFDLQIFAPNGKTVISNGEREDIILFEDRVAWRFNMNNPMSSYLAAVAIGDFDVYKTESNSGVLIELYFDLKDSLLQEPTYRYTKEMFDFLEAEIGIPYPWSNYKQVPVRDFLYAGMENTSATFFSEAFVVDSIGFNDRNYVNVNAHELAHQWFGNLVTETESTHHWLHEGFATFFALQAERMLFGEEYYYWKLYQSAEQLKALSDEGKGESLLNPKASSLTFYEKGAWALHILREEIGAETFKDAVVNYLQKYKYRNVTTANFLDEVKAVSGKNLEKFEADWLHQSAFKAEQAYESLIKSSFMNRYFEIASLQTVALSEKQIPLQTALRFPNDYIGQEVIYQLIDEDIATAIPFYKLGFESDNLYIRQAIAMTLQKIPTQLQQDYESLLDDASYVTQEAALYSLWVNFPEKRKNYLDKMEDVVGFQNRNIRQLWLVIALADSNYRIEDKNDFISELRSYTSPQHSFEIRETAFGYINDLNLWDESTARDLVNASIHHTWRFRKFTRKLLNEVLNDQTIKNMITTSFDSFSPDEQKYLATILD